MDGTVILYSVYKTYPPDKLSKVRTTGVAPDHQVTILVEVEVQGEVEVLV